MKCKEIINELNGYELISEDEELVNKIEKLLNQRDYKEIGVMI